MVKLEKKGNTKVIRIGDQGALQVKFHNTIVFSIDRTGVVTLNSGGFRTYTTKQRINQALAEFAPGLKHRVFQKAGVWYVSANFGPAVEFQDNMQIVVAS